MELDAISNQPTIPEGDHPLLAGRYRVVRRLGAGGMGEVFLVEDLKLDGRHFAVKMLPSFLSGNRRAMAALKREALHAMELSHPHIVTVRGFEETEAGQPFLVMDYIEGRTLEDLLVDRERLPEDEVIRLFTPIAEALDHAHSKGVIHRDVKPSNIMIRTDGTPVIMDFGVAREAKETSTLVTGQDTGSGTLPYMSPEQLRGERPTPSQDIYSLAATMWECVVGEPPFCRGDIRHQIETVEPAFPMSSGESSDLGGRVLLGLAKDPLARPALAVGLLVASPIAPVERSSKSRGEGPEGDIDAESELRARLSELSEAWGREPPTSVRRSLLKIEELLGMAERRSLRSGGQAARSVLARAGAALERHEQIREAFVEHRENASALRELDRLVEAGLEQVSGLDGSLESMREERDRLARTEAQAVSVENWVEAASLARARRVLLSELEKCIGRVRDVAEKQRDQSVRLDATVKEVVWEIDSLLSPDRHGAEQREFRNQVESLAGRVDLAWGQSLRLINQAEMANAHQVINQCVAEADREIRDIRLEIWRIQVADASVRVEALVAKADLSRCEGFFKEFRSRREFINELAAEAESAAMEGKGSRLPEPCERTLAFQEQLEEWFVAVKAASARLEIEIDDCAGRLRHARHGAARLRGPDREGLELEIEGIESALPLWQIDLKPMPTSGSEKLRDRVDATCRLIRNRVFKVRFSVLIGIAAVLAWQPICYPLAVLWGSSSGDQADMSSSPISWRGLGFAASLVFGVVVFILGQRVLRRWLGALSQLAVLLLLVPTVQYWILELGIRLGQDSGGDPPRESATQRVDVEPKGPISTEGFTSSGSRRANSSAGTVVPIGDAFPSEVIFPDVASGSLASIESSEDSEGPSIAFEPGTPGPVANHGGVPLGERPRETRLGSRDDRGRQAVESSGRSSEVDAVVDLDPLTLTLPIAGTSVTLEMRPIAAPHGPVYVSTTEATWDLYDAFIFNLDTDAGESTPESDAVTRPSKPYVLADRGYGHANFAVLSVSPKAAEQFVEWLSIKTGRTFRLPTLVEMQHLLATSGVADDDARLAHGWFEENADYSTHEVGTLAADANGLFDLWGNVSEYAVTPEGEYVVVGGSFIDPVAGVDLDYRIPFTPDWNADDPQIPKSPWWLASNDWVGIRLVCDP